MQTVIDKDKQQIVMFLIFSNLQKNLKIDQNQTRLILYEKSWQKMISPNLFQSLLFRLCYRQLKSTIFVGAQAEQKPSQKNQRKPLLSNVFLLLSNVFLLLSNVLEFYQRLHRKDLWMGIGFSNDFFLNWA